MFCIVVLSYRMTCTVLLFSTLYERTHLLFSSVMHSHASYCINNTGVGFPVDMPVMLTYFEGNELKPVLGDYPDYDHLMNHVAVQLDSNEFQLYRTPVVLTLQGEFEVMQIFCAWCVICDVI